VPDPVLAVEDLSVTYGSGAAAVLALDRISADFAAGQVTLLMGASGSGKTTLLSILGCLRKPDSGRVTILGDDVTRARDKELVGLRRDHIGFVFQFFRLFRSLSALENVKLGLDLSRESAPTPEAAKRALESVGLAGKHHLLPRQMSGGERQRVAIARALVKNPRILLADEPTAALDRTSGEQVAELIRSSARERGIVAVVATHDVRLLAIADGVMEIRDGKLHETWETPPR
jgi:putative ABC transport system ATP-binding protein